MSFFSPNWVFTACAVGGTGGRPATINGSPLSVGGQGGTILTVGGPGGTPVTVGRLPVTLGAVGGTPINVGATGGTLPVASPTHRRSCLSSQLLPSATPPTT